MTIDPYLATIGITLAGAVTTLFRIVMKQASRQSELSERVGRVEGENRGIEALSNETLEVVHDAITQRENARIRREQERRKREGGSDGGSDRDGGLKV